MKETRYKNIRRQIDNSICLIELYLPLIEKLDRTKNQLGFLPSKLEYLKKQARLLKPRASSVNTENPANYSDRIEVADSDARWEIDDTELELDFVVDSLEETLICLDSLKQQIGDLVVLRERVEALQEERLDSITPERIYKLLERQQSQNSEQEIQRSPSARNYFRRIWQEIADRQYSAKIAKSTAIVTGLILCFGLGSLSLMYQTEENNTVKVEEIGGSRTATDAPEI